jgi:hypothetical protein
MKIQVRATYQQKPKIGLIRVSKIVKNQPIEYNLQLFDETAGVVHTTKKLFVTMQNAISHASLYGFASSAWDIEEKEV